MDSHTFRLLTYNIHGGIGTDGRFDIGRTSSVIAETTPDLVALQEVNFWKQQDASHDCFEEIAGVFGGYAKIALTMDTEERAYGNMLLSRWPISRSNVLDISMPGREPRNAIRADIDTPAGPVRLMATHLGLRFWERRQQALLLAKALEYIGPDAAFVAGDFNDWRPIRDISSTLHKEMVNVGRRRTWPAGFPIFSLDRILKRRSMETVTSSAFKSRLSRQASDHLPLIADVRCLTLPH